MQFLSYLNERGNDGLMVIILTHARVKDAQGKCDILFIDLGTHQITFGVAFFRIYRKLSNFNEQFLQGIKIIN